VYVSTKWYPNYCHQPNKILKPKCKSVKREHIRVTTEKAYNKDPGIEHYT